MKVVPLVIYRNDERIVVGTSTLNDDGTVTSSITDPQFRAELTELVKQEQFSFGMNNPTMKREDHASG